MVSCGVRLTIRYSRCIQPAFNAMQAHNSHRFSSFEQPVEQSLAFYQKAKSIALKVRGSRPPPLPSWLVPVFLLLKGTVVG